MVTRDEVHVGRRLEVVLQECGIGEADEGREGRCGRGVSTVK